MRSHQWLFLALLPLLVAGLLWVACGGSEDQLESPDLSRIPTATPPDTLPEPLIVGESSPPPVAGATYTVQAGDSPASIAEQFGVTADAIMAANGITDPTKLEVGQVLTIPGAAPDQVDVLAATTEPPPATAAPPPTEPPEPAPPVDGEVYIVQAGDIPETIAAQFGITAEELMAANGIVDPTGLYIGQELIIPSPAPTATPEP